MAGKYVLNKATNGQYYFLLKLATGRLSRSRRCIRPSPARGTAFNPSGKTPRLRPLTTKQASKPEGKPAPVSQYVGRLRKGHRLRSVARSTRGPGRRR